MARELFSHSSIRHHKSGYDSKRESDISARAREIARDALNMSEVDLNTFFEEKLPGKVSRAKLSGI